MDRSRFESTHDSMHSFCGGGSSVASVPRGFWESTKAALYPLGPSAAQVLSDTNPTLPRPVEDVTDWWWQCPVDPNAAQCWGGGGAANLTG